MSAKLEEQLLYEIETKYIISGYYYNQVLRLTALAWWENAELEDWLRDTFKASSGLCRNFLKKTLLRLEKVSTHQMSN